MSEKIAKSQIKELVRESVEVIMSNKVIMSVHTVNAHELSNDMDSMLIG